MTIVTITEKDIENEILSFLEFLPGADFWKVDTTGVYDPKKGVYRLKRSRFKFKGISDIVGFYKGKFVAIEVKTPQRRNKTSKEQEEFLMVANKNDQIAFVACSVNEVKRMLLTMELIEGGVDALNE